MDEAFLQELTRRYGGPREPTASSAQWAPDYPMFRQHARTGASRYYGTLRGDKFGRVYVHSPETISVQELDEMRMDGQCRAGMMLIKLPIQRSPYTITCQDKDIANFISELIKPKWATLIRTILLGLDFGNIVGEKIWKHEYNVQVTNTQASLGAESQKTYPRVVTLDEVMMVDPLTIKLLAYNRSGKFAGFEQFTPRMAQVPASKGFIFSNDIEFRELYGVSRLKPCYPYWLFKRSMYEWLNVGMEKNSIPIRLVRFPEGVQEKGEDQFGNPVYDENIDVALNTGEQMDNENTIAIPSSVYEEKGIPHWDVSYLESNFSGQDFIAVIDHYNAQILKSLLIPELALQVGASGSYDLAQEQIRFFLLGLEATMDQIEEAVNDQIINPWVKYMFGAGAPECYLRFQPLADDMREGLTNVLLETVGQGQPIPLVDGSQMIVDWQKVAEDSGIPVQILRQEDMAMFRQGQQANQAAMPQDPNAPPGQEGSGGSGQDMPFGNPDQGRGYGAAGGASNKPGQQQQANPDDNEPGEMGLSDDYGFLDLADNWTVRGGRMVMM